ncbi:hypothetical protein [Halorubrum hochsteinianum]|uniref:hypothetical protein n=1 Tax=Halorubrum hochsteinianum TaxID=2949307 RepID=UPI002037661E|nr:hypothetical protein [Halorubrum hochsteinianum]
MRDLTIYDASQLVIGSSIAISGLLSLNLQSGRIYNFLMIGSGSLLVVFSIFHYASTEDEDFSANPILLIVLILAAGLVSLSVILNYLGV